MRNDFLTALTGFCVGRCPGGLHRGSFPACSFRYVPILFRSFFSPQILCGVGLVLLAFLPLKAQADWAVVDLPVSPRAGQALVLTIRVPQEAAWMAVFVRSPGEADFSGAEVESLGNGSWRCIIPAERVRPGTWSWYLAGKIPSGVRYLPEQAPGDALTLQVLPAGAAPMAEPVSPLDPDKNEPEKAHPSAIQLDMNGSVDAGIWEQGGKSGGWHHQHNLGVSLTAQSREWTVSLRSRLAWSDQALEGQKKLDLPELNLRVQRNKHLLEVGNLQFFGSEFSLSALGRRGVTYAFGENGPGLTARLFALNSQNL